MHKSIFVIAGTLYFGRYGVSFCFTLNTYDVFRTITSTSTAVLSLVVSEKVPHSSTAIPLLVAYFLYNMVILSISVILTAVVLRVHRAGRHGDEPRKLHC